MQLTTDLLVRKWKPKHKGESASCGSSVNLQGFTNGQRTFVFRAQPILDGIKKSYRLTLGKPSNSKSETKLGAGLTSNEASTAAMFLPQAIASGDYNVSQVKKSNR